jgi:hypothetical protein
VRYGKRYALEVMEEDWNWVYDYKRIFGWQWAWRSNTTFFDIVY